MQINKDKLSVLERVEYLLEKFPDLRDSDQELWLAYLNVFHDLSGTIGETAYRRLRHILSDCVGFESIRRTRQKLQESGKYLGKIRKIKLEEERKDREFASKSVTDTLGI